MWMHGWIAGEVKIWKALMGAALGWTCLWLSKSATSLLASVFASCLLLMLLRTSPAVRRYTPYLVTIFGCLVVAYALAVLQLVPGLATVLLGPITAITGKDMDVFQPSHDMGHYQRACAAPSPSRHGIWCLLDGCCPHVSLVRIFVPHVFLA